MLETYWSGRQDSNLRPPRPERGALPGCATSRILERAKVGFFIMTANTALAITLHEKLDHDF